MRITGYSFSLGRVGGLEKKIISPKILDSLTQMDFSKAIEQIRPYFFLSFKELHTPAEVTQKIEEEERFLKNICKDLVDKKLEPLFDVSKASFQLSYEASTSFSVIKEFFSYYGGIKNAIEFLQKENVSRKKKFGKISQKIEEEIRKIPYTKKLDDFKEEAKKLFLQEKVYLVEFLVYRYVLDFWKEKKWKNLLGASSVFWYFFAKSINLKIVGLILMYLLLKLDLRKVKEAIKTVYG